jgi:hypothetical protein
VAALWPIQPRLLGLRAAAQYVGVSTWTIRAWLVAGRLARVRLPGAAGGDLERLLLDRFDLDRLVVEGKGP